MTDSTTTNQLHPAEIAKLEAETAALKAEYLVHYQQAEYNAARARRENAEAVQAEIAARNEERYEQSLLAGDHYHRTYVYNGPIASSGVQQAMAKLAEWHRTANKETPEPIEIVFNSPGGSVIDGMALFDYIQVLRRAGHQITTTCYGMAASMAGILLQAGDVRVMGKESYLLIHEIAFGAGGKIGEIEDEVAFAKKIQGRIVKIFADRSDLTAAQIKKNWTRKDWWLDSDEALRLKLVDEVR
jgi:ATP-dependent Clp endopeptidase proteolytic subunit ClpP